MARLFEGSSGTSAYNAAEGKFDEVDSTYDSASGWWFVPFDFGTEANFQQKVDLSLAGNMMDCGECHVGGGMMQYIPYKDNIPQTADDMDFRIPLRDIASVDVNGFGPITAANYTAFNYFIDNYDVDNDGDETEVQYMDYTKTGVMEMDCLMCHLPGYKYEERRATLRDAKIDATRAIGAGFATDNGLTWADGAAAPVGYGTTVIYDTSMFEITGGNTLRLSKQWMDENVASKPDSSNCANCHMNEFSVDWKKRGDHWAPNGQYDFQYEVHYNLGCMGCHERKPTALQPDSGVDEFTSVYGGPYPMMAPGELGHDPAKGDSQYSGLYNKNDNAAFKQCQDCHINGAGGGEYAAPNPNAAHAAAGLTAAIAQGNTADGVAKISHIDMMHCSTCHSRKANSYAWGNTGNPLIDATGGDHEKRLTDHENDYVKKLDMTDNTSLAWYKGKLHRVSPSATMFWRDKNDMPESATGTGLDANEDGRPHGMDALLMTQVLATNKANGWGSITEDHHGDVRPIDFAERITALKNDVEAWTGGGAFGTGTAAIKFSVFHVNFMNQHGVSPASMAFGAGGCNDCHSPAAEFWNGTVDTTGDGNTMTYGTSTSQRVPFTKVNGFSQPTDWHPMQLDKFAKRSIAIQISNVATSCDDDRNAGTPDVACMTTRPVERSENMYEGTFMGAADYAASYTSSSAIDFSGFEKGWQLIVQVDDGTERLKMVSTNISDVAGLISNLGTNMTDGTFGFTITDNGAGGITVAGTGGNLIRLKAGNAASFKLTHAAYKNTPWTSVDGRTFNGRADWVAYLNETRSLGDYVQLPVASIWSLPSSIDVGSTVSMIANETVNPVGDMTYSWICNDTAGEVLEGASVQKTFSKVGAWNVTLKVTNAAGEVAQQTLTTQVSAPAPLADIALVTPVQPAGQENQVTFSNLPAHTMLYIIWGDGTKERVYDTAASIDVPHTFRMYSKYFDGTNYNYRTTVYVYNGSSRVDIKRETLSIAP